MIYNYNSHHLCIDHSPTMEDSAKRGGLPTSELFTVNLCDPNFAVS